MAGTIKPDLDLNLSPMAKGLRRADKLLNNAFDNRKVTKFERSITNFSTRATAGISRISSKTVGLLTNVKAIGGALAAAFAVKKVTDFFASARSEAKSFENELNTLGNNIDISFPGLSDDQVKNQVAELESFSQRLSRRLGISQEEILQAANRFTSAGFNLDQTKTLTRLSANASRILPEDEPVFKVAKDFADAIVTNGFGSVITDFGIAIDESKSIAEQERQFLEGIASRFNDETALQNADSFARLSELLSQIKRQIGQQIIDPLARVSAGTTAFLEAHEARIVASVDGFLQRLPSIDQVLNEAKQWTGIFRDIRDTFAVANAFFKRIDQGLTFLVSGGIEVVTGSAITLLEIVNRMDKTVGKILSAVSFGAVGGQGSGSVQNQIDFLREFRKEAAERAANRISSSQRSIEDRFGSSFGDVNRFTKLIEDNPAVATFLSILGGGKAASSASSAFAKRASALDDAIENAAENVNLQKLVTQRAIANAGSKAAGAVAFPRVPGAALPLGQSFINSLFNGFDRAGSESAGEGNFLTNLLDKLPSPKQQEASLSSIQKDVKALSSLVGAQVGNEEKKNRDEAQKEKQREINRRVFGNPEEETTVNVRIISNKPDRFRKARAR